MFAADEGGLLDGYETLFIDAAVAPPPLVEDMQGLEAMTWLAGVLRYDFEQANYGARIYGATGTFDGMVSEAMPGYWRKTDGQVCGGCPVWVPDRKHPLGKWFGEVAERLLPLPPLEVLDAILRRHGIEGSREPYPVMKPGDGGWAVRVHKPKPRAYTVPGVSRREDLVAVLWRV